MGSQYHKGLHYLSLSTAAATCFLIVVGALVTSNDAGLSVPDWPLSHGQWMPEMVGGVFYEHGHRMTAAFVGLLTVVLNLVLWRGESRCWVRRLGLLALGAMIAQGILGGITVLYFLPVPISVLHATIAQCFFCLVVMLALVTSSDWSNFSTPLNDGWSSLFRSSSPELKIASVATIVIFGQLILGATVRHSGTVHGTKGVFLVTPVLLLHLTGALAVAGVIGRAALVIFRSAQDEGTVRIINIMVGLLFVQLFLGWGAYITRVDPANQVQPSLSKVFITVSHVAVGALLLATSLLFVLRMLRLIVPKENESIGQSALAGQMS